MSRSSSSGTGRFSPVATRSAILSSGSGGAGCSSSCEKEAQAREKETQALPLRDTFERRLASELARVNECFAREAKLLLEEMEMARRGKETFALEFIHRVITFRSEFANAYNSQKSL